MVTPAVRPPDHRIHDPQATRAALNGWHVVARTTEVSIPRTAYPATLAPGALNEPVLLIRDEQGELRGLSNVCTHRGHVLVEAPRADARAVQCPYHGRCFGLDGRVIRSPGFDGVDVTTLEPLPPVQVATWGPLVFASLNPSNRFDAWLAGPLERLGFLRTDEWVAAERTVYDIDAHWTTYIENYLEGLHIPFVHPGLARTVDWRKYKYILQSQGNLQIAETDADGAVFSLPYSHPDFGTRVAAYYFWLFPTTMLNIYPWGLSLNTVEPRGESRTRVVFEAFVGDPSLRTMGAGSGLEQVEREDEAVVRSVQVGMGAHLFRPGRLSPQHERCVAQFRQLLAAMS